MNFSDRGSLPVGFSMSLAQDLKAMTNFVSLSEDKKENIVEYIEGSTTGYEAKDRITQVVNDLHNEKMF
ncbi:hypothetical protein [Anaeromicropila herbilytica]|uniref:Uncharacterized protein n=1 Tax=Anaeromicropila herbilytica TaxID=2785025 RepID=A0A7R7EPQ3_9FIRM|nr:hypothetical protein [Anaeromicropila herbilytica]BCN32771.1 hypothetical protein bsdtb5_40660 [Anaeromicropila herbilytica]